MPFNPGATDIMSQKEDNVPSSPWGKTHLPPSNVL